VTVFAAGVPSARAVGEVVALVAFFTNMAFVVAYSVLGPWWHSELGRNLVALHSALALALLPATLHGLFGVSTATSAAYAWFVDGAMACVSAIVVWRLVILVRLDKRPWWQRGRRDPDPP
jgi:hypothetical protein